MDVLREGLNTHPKLARGALQLRRDLLYIHTVPLNSKMNKSNLGSYLFGQIGYGYIMYHRYKRFK